MLNGRREGWIELSIVIDGHSVDAQERLMGATTLRGLRTVRKQLLSLPCAKREGKDLNDGDIMVDFHRDEPGTDGGLEHYVLDPVAFTVADALRLLPQLVGVPVEKLAAHINEYMPGRVSLERVSLILFSPETAGSKRGH